MLSLPKFGPAYKATFDAIYPTLAAKDNIPRYPFFLQGVFGHPRLMLSDGKHPNAAGVRRIVAISLRSSKRIHGRTKPCSRKLSSSNSHSPSPILRKPRRERDQGRDRGPRGVEEMQPASGWSAVRFRKIFRASASCNTIVTAPKQGIGRIQRNSPKESSPVIEEFTAMASTVYCIEIS